MNKKGNALAVVSIILALLVLAIYLVGIATRECKSNRDCTDNAYCGSDYECHKYPEEIVVQKNSFTLAALILGISMAITAYIYKTGKIPFRN